MIAVLNWLRQEARPARIVWLALLPAVVVLLGQKPIPTALILLMTICAGFAYAMTAKALGGRSPVSLDGGLASCLLLGLALVLSGHTNVSMIITSSCATIFFASRAVSSITDGQLHRICNPAMAGYVIGWVLFGYSGSGSQPMMDATSSASILLGLKDASINLSWAELQQSLAFGALGDAEDQWVNLAIWLSGLGLILLKRIRWEIAAGFVLAMTVVASLNYDASSETQGTALTQLFSGSSALIACFILSDPGTAPNKRGGALLLGLLAGSLLYLCRVYSPHADPGAALVLLLNLLAPALSPAWHQLERLQHSVSRWLQPSAPSS